MKCGDDVVDVLLHAGSPFIAAFWKFRFSLSLSIALAEVLVSAVSCHFGYEAWMT
jgi:hypothetical protein